MDTYAEVITTAIENGDMNLLPSLWNLTLAAKARGDGAIFRQRMTNKIPEIASNYGMEPTSTFPEFVSNWKVEMLYRELKRPTKVMLQLLKDKNKKGIEYLLAKYNFMYEMVHWPVLVKEVISLGDLEMAVFLVDLINKNYEQIYEYWNIGSQADFEEELVVVAAKAGNKEVVNYILNNTKRKYTLTAIAFETAVEYGYENLVRELIQLDLPRHVINNAAVLALGKEHVDLAEYLLQYANENGKKRFFENVCYNYHRDIIFRHIHEIPDEAFDELFYHITDEDDREMIDFLAKERPELLPGLIEYIDHVYDGGVDLEQEPEDENDAQFLENDARVAQLH